MAKAKTQDAIALLTEDHRKVESIFTKFKKLKDQDKDEKAELVKQVCTELKIHAQLEEEVFYPAVRESIEEDLVDEAEVEHSTVKQLVEELEAMEPGDDLYDAKVQVLSEYVEHHVEEEESEMMPKAKRAKVDVDALGEELMLRKKELQQEMGAQSRAAE